MGITSISRRSSLPWIGIAVPGSGGNAASCRILSCDGKFDRNGTAETILKDPALPTGQTGFLFVYPLRRLEQLFFTTAFRNGPVQPISLRRCWLFFHPGKELITNHLPRKWNPGVYLLQQVITAMSIHGNPLFSAITVFLDSLEASPEFRALNLLVRYPDHYRLADPGTLQRPTISDPGQTFSSMEGTQLLPVLNIPGKTTVSPKADSWTAPPQGSATSFLNADYLRTRLKGYHPREQQIRYTEAIMDGFRKPSHTYLEAPTGTGKTLGYLTAAAHALERNPEHRVCIATATLNLQDQIRTRDWPVLTHRFSNLRLAILKGKRNFLCLSALARQFASCVRQRDRSWDEVAAWLYLAIVAWRFHGDIEAIPRELRDWLPAMEDLVRDVRADLNCVPALCNRKICSHSVHQYQALRAAIVVINHFMVPFLPDQILDNCAAMIIDEADRFPDNFRNALTVEIQSREIARLLYRLEGSDKRRGFIQLLESDLKSRNQTLSELRSRLRSFREGLDRIQTVLTEEGCSPGRRIQSLPSFQGAEFPRLMKDLARQLSEVSARLESLGIKESSISAPYKMRCREYAHLFGKTAETVLDLAAGFQTREFVHSYTRNQSFWSLNKTPVYIQKHLDQLIFRSVSSVVLTSATLTVRNSFDFITHQLEIDGNKTPRREITVPAPFPWEKVSACFVDMSIPPYSYFDPDRMENYRRAVIRAVIDYSLAFQGRVLVLLMSHRELNHVYTAVAPKLESRGILVLKQHGSSLEEIRTFRTVPNSILLGVDRFWSGVDFPGDTLSLVLIAKAPNPALSNPLIAHRNQWEPGFKRHSYPVYGALRLRQGFGRLIRSRTDRGGMVILDSRYANAGWYPDHLAALPIHPRFEQHRNIIIQSLTNLIQNGKAI